MTDASKGFAMLSGKHDGTSLQAMPMLFTYKPVKKQSESSGTNSFQQAGGHEGVFKNSGPVLEKAVGEREKRFYEQAQAGQWPPGFLPKYYGDKGGGRIGIENMTHGMRCPCVIDLKMGTATVEAKEGNMMKKVRMGTLDLVTGSAAHGVRLEGMSVYRALESGQIKTTKAQSHAISAAANVNLQDVMMFFLTDESGVRRDIASRFLGHLEKMLYHFEHNNNRFLFIGSSILLIYDNDNTAPHSRWARALERGTRLHPDTYAALRRKTRVDVRMIDFAHTGPLPHGQQRDEGYITGLKSLIGALRLVRKSGLAPQRPIFSLATAAIDAQHEAALRKPQNGIPAGHESAPLMYPPQPEPPSVPHWNGTSYSFHHHHSPSTPLQHAHSHSQSQPHGLGQYTPPSGQYSGPVVDYGLLSPSQYGASQGHQSAPVANQGAAPPAPYGASQGQQPAPVANYGAAPPVQYEAAPATQHGASAPSYGAPPAGQYGAAPAPAYGASMGHYSAPSGHLAPPAGAYGAPPPGGPPGQYGSAPPPGGNYGASQSGGLHGAAPVGPSGPYGAPPGGSTGLYGAPPPGGGYGASPSAGLYGAPPGGPPAIATPPPGAFAPYQAPGSQSQSGHIAPSAPVAVGPYEPNFFNLLGVAPNQSPGPDTSRGGYSGFGRISEDQPGPGPPNV